jgi:hypothetical protein
VVAARQRPPSVAVRPRRRSAAVRPRRPLVAARQRPPSVAVRRRRQSAAVRPRRPSWRYDHDDGRRIDGVSVVGQPDDRGRYGHHLHEQHRLRRRNVQWDPRSLCDRHRARLRLDRYRP